MVIRTTVLLVAKYYSKDKSKRGMVFVAVKRCDTTSFSSGAECAGLKEIIV